MVIVYFKVVDGYKKIKFRINLGDFYNLTHCQLNNYTYFFSEQITQNK